MGSQGVGHDWVSFTSLLILYVLSLSAQLSVTPWTVARQAPLSMGILQARVLEWVAVPPPGDLPNPGIEPRSPALQVDSLLSAPLGKPKNTGVGDLSMLQVIFPTQELNQGLLHCRWILCQLIYQGRPINLYSIPRNRKLCVQVHVPVTHLQHACNLCSFLLL